MSPPKPVWTISAAQQNLQELADRALRGSAQVLREQNGSEVVIVSKATYDSLIADARKLLLQGGKGPEKNDPLDTAIDQDRR